jgi:hypothetical protein
MLQRKTAGLPKVQGRKIYKRERFFFFVCLFFWMNYAEDRLDRQARDDPERLWCQCCSVATHGELATLWRNIGWSRHAVFHYSQTQRHHDNNNNVVGDYAQMAELAGFPEVAVLILLAYRSNCNYQNPSTCDDVHLQIASRDSSWLQQSAEAMENRDCGCGMVECGKSPCHISCSDVDLEPVFSALEEYNRGRLPMIRRRQQSTDRPQDVMMEHLMTAHEIIGVKFLDPKKGIHEKQNLDLSECISPPIPPLLQFWKAKDGYRSLSPVLQLLLLKLLYIVLPSLAVEAIVYMNVDEDTLAKEFKSHWAYFLLVRSLVLGERIKPHRRKLQKYHHIALWDRLWRIGAAIHDSDERTIQGMNDHPSELVPRLKALVSPLRVVNHHRKNNHSTPNLVWEPPFDDETQLFLVGDSHVLSLAWQTIQIHPNSDVVASPRNRVIVPVVVTGLKAWHVRPNTRFFTHTNLRIALERILSNDRQPKTILVSAGEIDCREGMGGPLLQGYRESCHDVVQNTAREYVQGLYEICIAKHSDIHQVLVLPVAPHLQNNKGRVQSRESRLETMRVWNQELRQLLPFRNTIYFLDYVEEILLVPPPSAHADDKEFKSISSPYALNPIFNADSTHLNSAFAPLLQRSLETCGCDLDKL